MTDDLGENINEKRLFHGTVGEAIQNICKTNFDFRNSGERVGALYGQGRLVDTHQNAIFI